MGNVESRSRPPPPSPPLSIRAPVGWVPPPEGLCYYWGLKTQKYTTNIDVSGKLSMMKIYETPRVFDCHMLFIRLPPSILQYTIDRGKLFFPRVCGIFITYNVSENEISVILETTHGCSNREAFIDEIVYLFTSRPFVTYFLSQCDKLYEFAKNKGHIIHENVQPRFTAILPYATLRSELENFEFDEIMIKPASKAAAED